MKFYPQLEINDSTRSVQEEFGGYNHNLRIPENQFYNMKNMSGDNYPVLSPRKKRGLGSQLQNCTAVICKDALCYIDVEHGDRGMLYINGEPINPFRLSRTAEIVSGQETYTHVMVAMGAYLIIFRKHSARGLVDGWYYNTADSSDYGYLDNNYSDSQQITLSTCGYDGNNYQCIVSDTEPTEKVNGTKWLDTSGDVHIIQVWSENQSMWVPISTTYVKISAPGIADGFKRGDGITISGITADNVSDAVQAQIDSINTTTIIQSIDEENHNWLVVVGILDQTLQVSGSGVEIVRQAPYMDYVCEHNNRLWGCRYGLNRNGDTVNEIYSCKQADFKNWFCYTGISSDSYAVSVGSDERWTGCTPFGNSVLFFKENTIHKLYGTAPSNFQTSDQKVRGIQRGSESSLCFVNEVLFYKSVCDIVAYDGSTPKSISAALGDVKYKNAVFGSINNKLYCNMQDDSGEWHLFVYDISSQTWHREDNLHCKFICRVDTDLYFVDSNNKLCTFTGGGQPANEFESEDDFEWYAETGNIGYSYPDSKYLSKISVRFGKPVTSDFKILIQYDDSKIWSPISALSGHGIKSVSLPILPRRCDHFRLRFEGKGECNIYSITKTIESGSEI